MPQNQPMHRSIAADLRTKVRGGQLSPLVTTLAAEPRTRLGGGTAAYLLLAQDNR
jgi:hypothetical protein